jgi:hypothetical protein
MEGSPGFFVNESKLWQKFSVKLCRRFHVCHTQIDVIETTRFHIPILNRIASQFNQGRARSPVRAVRNRDFGAQRTARPTSVSDKAGQYRS